MTGRQLRAADFGPRGLAPSGRAAATRLRRLRAPRARALRPRCGNSAPPAPNPAGSRRPGVLRLFRAVGSGPGGLRCPAALRLCFAPPVPGPAGLALSSSPSAASRRQLRAPCQARAARQPGGSFAPPTPAPTGLALPVALRPFHAVAVVVGAWWQALPSGPGQLRAVGSGPRPRGRPSALRPLRAVGSGPPAPGLAPARQPCGSFAPRPRAPASPRPSAPRCFVPLRLVPWGAVSGPVGTAKAPAVLGKEAAGPSAVVLVGSHTRGERVRVRVHVAGRERGRGPAGSRTADHIRAQPWREATLIASADFLLAAAFLWMTPFETALSS
ncbi:hypothetical protein SAMN05428939_5086 [Streptomyces sp. TLI_105]|nr:hypothetical protein SAMN05428939_5086 [Streptomyces sp. TLI_105]